ncbi:hypothetical protein GQ44DRAFT_462249 [Phaeosphaeriaceae sp. PMI808]|nr:hypothetical protein GQ44DRAFT_462249 [Phaeosphaeriaceae sp. PMI808]
MCCLERARGLDTHARDTTLRSIKIFIIKMTYRCQDLSERSIRLLSLLPGRSEDPIRCLIFEASLSSNPDICPAYEALSYIWDDHSNPQSLRVVLVDGRNGGRLDLGLNLYSALLHLRLEDLSRIM